MVPTPLRQVRSLSSFGNLFVKDESTLTGGTFKDRLASLAVDRAGSEATTFATLSYGNTAVSLARRIQEANAQGSQHRLVVAVPKDFDSWNFGPSSFGTRVSAIDILRELTGIATVVRIDITEDILDDSALRVLAERAGVACERFVNVTEGLDVPAYVGIISEAVAQLGRPPDVCVVPFGAGILCNEIRDYLANSKHSRVVPISVSSRDSMAKMLFGPVWLDAGALEAQGVTFSRHASPDRTGALRVPYQVWRIDESEILEGLRIASEEGISAEPSGAAGFGVLHRLDAIIPGVNPAKDVVLVINTGNGIDGLRSNISCH